MPACRQGADGRNPRAKIGGGMGFPSGQARDQSIPCISTMARRDWELLESASAPTMTRWVREAHQQQVSRGGCAFRKEAVAAAHLPAPRGRGRDRHPHGPRRRGLSGRRLGRAPDRRAIEPDRPRTQRPRADPPTLAPFWSLTPDKARRHHDNGCFGRQPFILPAKQTATRHCETRRREHRALFQPPGSQGSSRETDSA